MNVTIKMTREVGSDPSVALPSYETVGAAGADVRANFEDGISVNLAAGARVLVPTGLRMEIPVGFEVQVRPRSGLALKNGVTLANSPGTIDSDYRGPVGVILLNTSGTSFVIEHGMRIAQLVVAPVVQGVFTLSDTLDETNRGADGFGSTGRD